jgi:hypothetical protein
LGSPKPLIGNQVRHILIILSLLLFTSPLYGQSERPETIIIPVSSMGDVSDTRKQILQNTLEDELKSHFRLVPQEKYEEVLEKVFEELDYQECSEDVCILRVQEMLQVENVFHLQVIGEGQDTQLSLSWRTLDEKRKETDVCLGCGTFQLNDKVRGLVEKLVGVKKVEQVVVVEKRQKGVLYLTKVNGKFGWFENSNDKKDWKYEGEIKNGKPNGTGVLKYPLATYSGEVKNGIQHGQGTYTYKSGRKRVGEFRKGKPWNVKSYDKNGKIETEWVKGKKLKQEEDPLEEKEVTEYKSAKIRVRALLGNTSGKASTSNSSLSLIWENYGLGFNQMSFKTTSSKNVVYEMKNSSLDLSYTLDLSYIIDWTVTAGVGYVYGGEGAITSASSAIKYETESVSGFGLFGLLGIVWEGLEGLIGARYYSTNYTDFNSTNTSEVSTLVKPYPISDTQLIFGLGYSF